MNNNEFDNLTRKLAIGFSRREMLKMLGGGLGSFVLTLVGVGCDSQNGPSNTTSATSPAVDTGGQTQLSLQGDVFGAKLESKSDTGTIGEQAIFVTLDKQRYTEFVYDLKTKQLSELGATDAEEVTAHKEWRLKDPDGKTHEFTVDASGALTIDGQMTKLTFVSPNGVSDPSTRTIQAFACSFCLAFQCGSRCQCCTCFHRCLGVREWVDFLCGCG